MSGFHPDRPLVAFVNLHEPMATGRMNRHQADVCLAELADIFAPFKAIGLTDTLPTDRNLGTFCTANLTAGKGGVAHPYTKDGGGVCPFRLWTRTELYSPAVVAAVWCGDPLLAATMLAHEIGHFFAPEGLNHEPGTIMDPGPAAPGRRFSDAYVSTLDGYAYELCRGRRKVNGNWVELAETDPNWALGVWTTNWLYFAGGPCPKVAAVPAGWKVWPTTDPHNTAGEKLLLDFGHGEVFWPGPVSGSPTADPDGRFVFEPGPAPRPEFGPDRGGPMYGWQRKTQGTALVIDPAARVVYVP